MGSVRLSDTTHMLFIDFRYCGKRCREYTALPDTQANRKKLDKVLDRIESEIAGGTFIYENYFPNSKALKRIAKGVEQTLEVVTQASNMGCCRFRGHQPKLLKHPQTVSDLRTPASNAGA